MPVTDPDPRFDPLRDRLYRGGRVLTLDPAAPRAEAVAVRGGRVLAVGAEEAVRAVLAPDAETVDLQGGCLLPAFHDAHVHLTLHGLALRRLNLAGISEVDEVAARVRAVAAEQEAGRWVLGSAFVAQRLGVPNLHRDVLDAAAPAHPVLLRSQDHHGAWVNGEALRRAGIHAGTPDPPGGTIVRDDDGAPTGYLLERAVERVLEVVPAPAEAELRAALEEAGRDLAGYGVGTVHHMAYEPPDHWRALALAASRDAFPLRVWACVPQQEIEAAARLGLATGQGGGRFTVGGAKFFVDGALGSLTGWMLEPYGGSDDRGLVLDGPEVLRERMPAAIRAGLAPVAHAIGDAANRAVLDVLEVEADAWRAAGLRPRVEHAQHVHPDDVRRLGGLGLVASMQPLHLTFDAPTIHGPLADREERAYPLRALREAGAVIALGSDTPVAPPGVLAGMAAAVTRRGEDGSRVSPQHAVDAATALAGYTRDAAAAIGREGRSGVLRAGADADFTVLARDPTETPAEDLAGVAVWRTVVGGRTTFVA